MKTTSMKRTLKAAHPFDASSALLFAVLSIGAVSAVYAQTTSNNPPLTAPANSTQTRPAAQNPGFAPPMPAGKSATTPSPALAPRLGSANTHPALQAQSSQAGVAFTRADANKDGKLSAKEAVMLPAISEKFDTLDSNKDKFLSLEEFALATKS